VTPRGIVNMTAIAVVESQAAAAPAAQAGHEASIT
jgi:hypothetical protein